MIKPSRHWETARREHPTVRVGVRSESDRVHEQVKMCSYVIQKARAPTHVIIY